jgi:hypothetical protein
LRLAKKLGEQQNGFLRLTAGTDGMLKDLWRVKETKRLNDCLFSCWIICSGLLNAGFYLAATQTVRIS